MPLPSKITSCARVLVVDDDEVDRERLRRLAARIPIVGTIVGAANADEALAELARGDCDVVLLDLQLGNESGVDLLPKLRARAALVPCVLLTGMHDPEVIVAAMRAGALDYVAKDGLTVERLEQALRNALRAGAAARELAAARAALERQVSVLGSLVELAMRVPATKDAEEALRTGVRAGSVLFGARVTIELTHEGRHLRAEHSPVPPEQVSPSACRLAVPLTDTGGSEFGQLVCDRPAPPFDHVDELAAAQLARAVAGAMEKHELVAECRLRQREREEIVAFVAHDLRAPLQTFAFGIDSLRESEDREARDLVLTRMQRSTRQMTRLIDDLLDVSRIHDGKLSLRIGRVTASHVLERVLDQLGPLAADRRVTLAAEPAPATLTLLADEARLEQAMANLVTNAVRLAPGGHVTLRARAEGDALILEVQDDGPGVPPETRRKLFERLYQGEVGHRGTLGLGLYIVRGIAEAHGGSVGVDDAPARGSCFWIRVPLTGAPHASSTP